MFQLFSFASSEQRFESLGKPAETLEIARVSVASGGEPWGRMPQVGLTQVATEPAARMMDVATFLKLADALAREKVAYVLVGGLAMFAQGLPRATKDVGLFVETTAPNIERLKTALRSVYNDASIDEIHLEDLAPPDGGVIRYGPPEGDYVVDILGRLGETWSFQDLESQSIEIDGVPVCVATPRTLFRMKRDTVRLQDRADAQALAEKFDLQEE